MRKDAFFRFPPAGRCPLTAPRIRLPHRGAARALPRHNYRFALPVRRRAAPGAASGGPSGCIPHKIFCRPAHGNSRTHPHAFSSLKTRDGTRRIPAPGFPAAARSASYNNGTPNPGPASRRRHCTSASRPPCAARAFLR